MRVVLDTNVLISGTFWAGDSFHILQMIEAGKHILILSKEILVEYDRIVHSDEILEKQAYDKERADVVRMLLTLATVVIPRVHFTIVKEDPDDDKFLEAAVDGKADVIITKDNHLLKLREFRGITIITPKKFLEHESASSYK